MKYAILFYLTLHKAMNLASSDNSSGNGRAATRASYGSNSFERIKQSQKHEREQLLANWLAILRYIKPISSSN